VSGEPRGGGGPGALPRPGLEPAFRAEVVVGDVLDLGKTSAGHRRVVPILGGTVTGAVVADVLPGGQDLQLVRPNGTVEVSADYALRTAVGDLVLVHSRGLRSGPPGIVEALLAGAAVDPADYYFRLTLSLETTAAPLAWLQERILVAVAARTAGLVTYQAYALS
jgi:hypothetical protein